MRTLRKGDSGEDVRTLQTLLNSIGFNCGTADGIYGTKTVEAVKRFQERYGLTVDGVAGPSTQTRLSEVTADPTVPELPEDDDEHDTPDTPVVMSRAKALALKDALRRAQEILDEAMA